MKYWQRWIRQPQTVWLRKATIRLTPNGGQGAATYFYPTNPTATTFAIQFCNASGNIAPGAGVVVAWEIHTLGG